MPTSGESAGLASLGKRILRALRASRSFRDGRAGAGAGWLDEATSDEVLAELEVVVAASSGFVEVDNEAVPSGIKVVCVSFVGIDEELVVDCHRAEGIACPADVACTIDEIWHEAGLCRHSRHIRET